MRNTPWIWCVLFVVGAVCLTTAQRGPEAAPKPEQFVGTWSASWEGAGSGGGFEVTLEQAKEKDGPVTGKVSVTGEPTYKATFKSLAFDGKKMTARYDFPADESAEVVLAGTFEDKTATGTWSLRAKAGGDEVVSGTWTVTRKP